MFNSFPDPGEGVCQLTKQLHFIISGIRRVPKPVIAMINRTTAGGGFSLAAACDLRICASSAKFRQAYTSVGFAPDGAWTLLTPLLIGFSKASELAYLDPVFGVKEALVLFGPDEKIPFCPDLSRPRKPLEMFFYFHPLEPSEEFRRFMVNGVEEVMVRQVFQL